MIIRIRIIAICLIFSGAALAALFCSGRLVLNTTYIAPFSPDYRRCSGALLIAAGTLIMVL